MECVVGKDLVKEKEILYTTLVDQSVGVATAHKNSECPLASLSNCLPRNMAFSAKGKHQ